MGAKAANGNWKGGVTKFTHIDQFLGVPDYLHTKLQEFNDSIIRCGSTGCWIWTGKLSSVGRAVITLGARLHHAARFAYVAINDKPIGQMYACHSCDNILCVNPEHLWLGTAADNSQDMVRKGRQRDQRGVKHNLHVLDDNTVRAIRKELKEGKSIAVVSGMFGVSKHCVFCVKHRKTWSHVK
jgi:hypothetical protein